jgi:hypothetical protein
LEIENFGSFDPEYLRSSKIVILIDTKIGGVPIGGVADHCNLRIGTGRLRAR